MPDTPSVRVDSTVPLTLSSQSSTASKFEPITVKVDSPSRRRSPFDELDGDLQFQPDSSDDDIIFNPTPRKSRQGEIPRRAEEVLRLSPRIAARKAAEKKQHHSANILKNKSKAKFQFEEGNNNRGMKEDTKKQPSKGKGKYEFSDSEKEEEEEKPQKKAVRKAASQRGEHIGKFHFSESEDDEEEETVSKGWTKKAAGRRGNNKKPSSLVFGDREEEQMEIPVNKMSSQKSSILAVKIFDFDSDKDEDANETAHLPAEKASQKKPCKKVTESPRLKSKPSWPTHAFMDCFDHSDTPVGGFRTTLSDSQKTKTNELGKSNRPSSSLSISMKVPEKLFDSDSECNLDVSVEEKNIEDEDYIEPAWKRKAREKTSLTSPVSSTYTKIGTKSSCSQKNSSTTQSKVVKLDLSSDEEISEPAWKRRARHPPAKYSPDASSDDESSAKHHKTPTKRRPIYAPKSANQKDDQDDFGAPERRARIFKSKNRTYGRRDPSSQSSGSSQQSQTGSSYLTSSQTSNSATILDIAASVKSGTSPLHDVYNLLSLDKVSPIKQFDRCGKPGEVHVENRQLIEEQHSYCRSPVRSHSPLQTKNDSSSGESSDDMLVSRSQREAKNSDMQERVLKGSQTKAEPMEVDTDGSSDHSDQWGLLLGNTNSSRSSSSVSEQTRCQSKPTMQTYSRLPQNKKSSASVKPSVRTYGKQETQVPDDCLKGGIEDSRRGFLNDWDGLASSKKHDAMDSQIAALLGSELSSSSLQKQKPSTSYSSTTFDFHDDFERDWEEAAMKSKLDSAKEGNDEKEKIQQSKSKFFTSKNGGRGDSITGDMKRKIFSSPKKVTKLDIFPKLNPD